MISVKNVLIALAVAFSAYLAARGLWWTEAVPYPLVLVATLGLYLATTWLCIFWEPSPPPAADSQAVAPAGGPARLPVAAQVLAIAAAAIVPSAVSLGVGLSLIHI